MPALHATVVYTRDESSYLEMLTPELAKGLQNRQRIIIEDLTAEVTRLRSETTTLKAARDTAAGDVGRLSDLLAEAKVSLLNRDIEAVAVAVAVTAFRSDHHCALLRDVSTRERSALCVNFADLSLGYAIATLLQMGAEAAAAHHQQESAPVGGARHCTELVPVVPPLALTSRCCRNARVALSQHISYRSCHALITHILYTLYLYSI
eukprot:3774-Heterococcus_DN1.PRE.2